MGSRRYIAQKFVAPSPDSEIMGGVIMAYAQTTRHEDIKTFLKQYDLEAIDPNKWYPIQLVLDFQRAIAEAQVNSVDNLVALGMKVVETVPFNPDTRTIEQAILDLNSMSQHVQRNIPDDCGWFVIESSPGYTLIVDNMPYHNDVIYGFLWQTAKRFRPEDAPFTVHRVDNPQPDRYPGIAYEIRWG